MILKDKQYIISADENEMGISQKDLRPQRLKYDYSRVLKFV